MHVLEVVYQYTTMYIQCSPGKSQRVAVIGNKTRINVPVEKNKSPLSLETQT